MAIDESTDVWPIGNMLYILLTGLWPYYNETDYERIQELSLRGVVPFIDPRYQRRSEAERRLVELMHLCYRRNPEDRVDIFTVVQHLRETLRLYHHGG